MFLSCGGFYFGFYLTITSPVIRENYPQNFRSKTEQDPHDLSWVLLLAGMAFGP
jgi:amino acid permease